MSRLTDDESEVIYILAYELEENYSELCKLKRVNKELVKQLEQKQVEVNEINNRLSMFEDENNKKSIKINELNQEICLLREKIKNSNNHEMN